MAPKRPLQRTGASQRAAHAAEAARAAALAFHLEAEHLAFAEAQRIALEEAAKHDTKLRREEATHQA